MYEGFYGFTRRPFSAVPSVDQYFPAESIEQARQSLIRVVERVEGVGMVVGPAGTGKTLLCQTLAEYFQEQLRIVLLTSARLGTRRALLQSILFELKLPFRNLAEGEMRLALMDYLEPTESCPDGMLLILDEAHTVPLRLLEEVRLISNLVRHGRPRVRLVLAGSSLLEEHLAHPRLESFNQRIATRCYLHAFHRSEVARYIRQALDRVGGDADAVFTADAYSALARLTNGVPRLLNQLGDHTLLLAYLRRSRQIDARRVEEAWAELQRLPAPAPVPEQAAGESIIEFGPLADESPTDGNGPLSAAALPDADMDAAMDAEVSSRGGMVEAELSCTAAELWHEASETANEAGSEATVTSDGAPTVGDVFGGPFADEEVVLDRFLHWEELGHVARVRVTCPESRWLADAFAAASRHSAASEPTGAGNDLRESDEGAAAWACPEVAAEESCALEDQVAVQATSLLDLVEQGRLGRGEFRAGDFLGDDPPTDGVEAKFELSGDVTWELPSFDADGCEVASLGRSPVEIAERLAGRANDGSSQAGANGDPPGRLSVGLWSPPGLIGDDRDIILIEDEVPGEPPPAARPRATRREYRRLFGQLRRPA